MNLPNVRSVFSHVARRWRLLFHKPDVEQELTHELRQHLEMEAEDLVHLGRDVTAKRCSSNAYRTADGWAVCSAAWTRVPLDTVVVDRIDRVPTEN